VPVALAIIALVALATGLLAYAVGRGDGQPTPSSTVATTLPRTTTLPPTSPLPPATTALTAPAVVSTAATPAPSSSPPATVPAPANTTPAVASTARRTTTVAPTTVSGTNGRVTTIEQASAPTTTAAVAPAPIGRPDPRVAEQFVRRYYELVDQRDYVSAWALLAPEFQRGRPGSYASYVRFWEGVDDVEVLSVDVVDGPDWPVVTRLAMRYTTADGVVDELDELTLRPGPDGSPLISDYRPVRPL